MSFVHPGIFIAAGGLALVPIIIHFINRRRYQREPWAAMDFLRAAHRTTKRRMHIEQWLLMALRCLAVILLGLTIARPFVSGDTYYGHAGQQRCDRVIVIDDSLSMQARRDEGRSAFDEAKLLALSIVDGAATPDGLAVLTSSTLGRRWMQQPVHDRQAVRSIIESLTCSAGMNDLGASLRNAQENLSRGSAAAGCRMIYVVTDVTKSAMKNEPDHVDPAIVDPVFVIDAGPQHRDNLAIESFTAASVVAGVRIPARFHLTMANHSQDTAASIGLDVQMDGGPPRRLVTGP